MLHPRTRGFTLLELIVVLVVLGLLAAIAIPTYNRIVTSADETREAASWAAIARAATATAAADRALPPGPEYFQAIIDETDFTAAAAGVLAQGDAIIVVEPGDPTDGATRVFYWGEDDNTAVIISPSETTDTKCVAVAVASNTVDSAIIDPTDHGADAADAVADQCVPTVALNWALDQNTPVDPPPSTTTTTTTIPEPDPVVPPVPADLAGVGHSTGVDLTWTAVPEAGATYDLARNGTDPTVEDLTGVAYGDTGLDSSTAYTYRVRACVDECSAWSDEISVTTAPPAPEAPSGFAFTNSTSNAISFAWNSTPGAANYEVQRQGVETPVSTAGTTHTWSGLAASANTVNTYDFRVRGCNVTGCSAWTEYASMTTAGYRILTAVSTAADANIHSGYTGSYTVPAGVKRVHLQAQGGAGSIGVRCADSAAAGGAGTGANMRATRNVAPGDTLDARAGRRGRGSFGGWPGGRYGSGPAASVHCGGSFGLGGGGGGGYSSWTHNGTQVLVGAGGGGGGSTVYTGSATGGHGGAAGATTGGAGGNGGSGFGLSANGGAGGHASGAAVAGGGATCAASWTCANGGNGTSGTGGNGGSALKAGGWLGFGGGGGGGVGGGGGGGSTIQNDFGVGWGGGGGGGSSAGYGVTGYTAAAAPANAEGVACFSWHGNTSCGGGSAPFVP